jgi:YD repeat-containing protein
MLLQEEAVSRYQEQKQALDLEVASGKLIRTVRHPDPDKPNKYSVVYIDAKTKWEVGFFTSNSYWSVSTYDDLKRLVHYDDANNRWLHVRYSSAGEITSIVDARGVWRAINTGSPTITFNEWTGEYRHHLRSTMHSEDDVLEFIHAHWDGAERDEQLAAFNAHRLSLIKKAASPSVTLPRKSRVMMFIYRLFAVFKTSRVEHAN